MIKSSINKKLKIIILFFIIGIGVIIYHFIYNIYSNQYVSIRKGPDMMYDAYVKAYLKLKNGNIFIIGNDFGDNPEIEQGKTAQMYIYNDNKFIKLPNTNFVHRKQIYLFEVNNKVYILDNNPVEIYDIFNNKFIKTNLCIAEDNCSLSTNTLTTFKAFSYINNSFLIYAPFSRLKLYLWNYKTGEKLKLPNFNIDRVGYHVLYLKNGKLAIIGGYEKDNIEKKVLVKKVEIYNPEINKFIELADFELDSDIVSADYNEAKFKTLKFEYTFDYNRNNFIKRGIKKFDKKYKIIKLNDKYSLLTYTSCNIIFCKPKSKLYLSNENKIYQGPDLLYWTISPNKFINTKTNSFLIFGVNYETSSHYPIKGTEQLIIK